KNCIQLRFIDLYRFLASSLDKLVSFLSKNKLRVLRREISHLSDENLEKVKGVKSNVVARSITFDDYTRCFNDAIEMTRRQSCIRSKLHEVYTISETKIALSPHDDKRYIVSGSTDTLPWGHYRCK
ncbi:hypothetical protein ALC62_16013, partial [Cyphomyrmex costatus]